MRRSARLLVPALAALIAVSACQRREAETDTQQTGAPAPATETPLTYQSETPYAAVELTLPETIKDQPQLVSRLYREGVDELATFNEGAQADRTEFGGAEDLPPYAKEITWTETAETDGLISLARTDYDFTGGAHGNTLYSAMLWDKALGRPVRADTLFAPGADMARLDQALCTAINAAKKARDPSAPTIRPGGTDWACPKASATPYALAASTTPGKAGGLTFLIGPYMVGPYAEGSYEIVLPLSTFQNLLGPEYADQFGGQPTRVGDVTPRG
ncbi:DUF3298 and DUF4163 domain-containing protein [Brevundimonas lutea]|uniref:DUF3298 and DUF4163 domain-containing protein n=1 Tax=Brevundimonas lutea TaxID=2293980 RepID=UPI000F026B78|nr:DUF3298 and DUF4163 domain-containing protein [Brevundimonas lutea]